MFLDRTTIARLAGMLEPHMERPAWPGLDDPAVKRRSAERAKKLGIWERLSKRVDGSSPIPVIKRSLYRDYRRTGIRRRCEALYRERVERTTDTALALWLGHPAGDIDLLQDLLWAWCETTTWIWPAHERCTVDLASSARGRALAEIVWMFRDELEDEVKERVWKEIDRRILDGAHDWRRPDGWQTREMNWNHVCNANIITTALYRIGDAGVLAAYIHPLIGRLEYAIHGFAEDGGCREGPGYWNYGFGHFLDAAVVLHNRTGGELDLMRGEEIGQKTAEKIKRICRYPLAAHIEGEYRATFADSTQGFLTVENALKINRFLDIPELFAIVAPTGEGLPEKARTDVADWRALSLARPDGSLEAATGPVSPMNTARDCLLPDLGQVKLRAGEGSSKVTLVALAGSNDVPHNHNDIGSFIYFAKGRPLLTDPGAPEYTRKTFSPERYEILFCRSRGHSVPIINGKEQPAGTDYRGTLRVAGLDSEGEKRATIDMTRAYDDDTLTSLVREFVLSPDGGLVLTDTYEFTHRPESIEEAFITCEEVDLADGGVRVGEAGRDVTITAKDTPGTFAVERLVEESKEGRTGEVVSRVTFTPAELKKSMRLAFEVAER